jgi:hypothetical protein
LFYPQMTLMTQIFWGVMYGKTSRKAAKGPKG